MAQTQPRQNYHADCEAGVNKQVNLELYGSYVYQSMAFYFDRDDVAMKGLYKFFRECSEEERERAEKLMKYQNTRGGRVVLQNIQKPDRDDWGTALEAITAALSLQKSINQALLDLHNLGSTNVDPQFCDFLESHFLGDLVESIRKMSDYITQLKRAGPGLGEFVFDKEALDD